MSRRRRKRDRPDFGALQAFAVECPGCLAHVAVARTLAGRAARCPACDLTFLVPAPPAEEPSLPDPFAGRSRSRRKTAPLPAFKLPPVTPAPPAPAPEPPAPAPEPPAPAPHFTARSPEPPRAVPLPDPSPRPVDLPLVFSEPPPPSTRRAADEPPPPAAATQPSAPPATAVVGIDDTATSSPEGCVADDASPPASEPVDPGLAFRDPVKTVRSGGAEIELRQLSPEEKRTRRARRNLLILVVGAALLVALAVILGTGGR